MARRTPSHPARALAAATLALVLVAGTAACSSDDPDGGSATTTTAKAGSGTGPKGTEPEVLTTTTKPDPSKIKGGKAEYSKAILDIYGQGDTEVFSKEDATCVAPKMVEAIGVDTFKEAGVSPEQIASGEKALADLKLLQPEADRIIAAMESCGIVLQDLVLAVYSGGTELSATQRTCLQAALPDATVRAIMSAQFRGNQPPESLFEEASKCA
jgi:hypothetical protein